MDLSPDIRDWKANQDDNPKVDGAWDFLQEEPIYAPKYLSWDSFEDGDSEVPLPSYITEAGPRVFDAALADEEDIFGLKNQDYIVLEMSIYVSSLLAMGLGRGSPLFTFDEKSESFVQVEPKIRISGCTGNTVEAIRAVFMDCGNLVRRLQGFVEKTYWRNDSSTLVALADTVSTLLRSLQRRLQFSLKSSVTLLEAQETFRPVYGLLKCFNTLVDKAKGAENEEHVLSILFDEILALENQSESTTKILIEVLSHVSRPFLDFAAQWLGTKEEPNNTRLQKDGVGRCFITTEARQWIDEQGIDCSEQDYALDEIRVPSFMDVEDARLLFETGRSLRFLRSHHSDHPLAQQHIMSKVTPPSLDWQTSWQQISDVEAKALQYERDLRTAIAECSASTCSVDPPSTHLNSGKAADEDAFNYFSMPEEAIETRFLASISAMEHFKPHVSGLDDLSILIKQLLVETGAVQQENDIASAVPLSLSAKLSFGPLIAAQARIVNAATMRLFFGDLNLREHLSLQRRFHLLGDGVFSSRLSHALFDPELETAERQAGVARSGGLMGLRLEGRDTWPPATSELRLSLMGVLSESYTIVVSLDDPEGLPRLPHMLPGDLSFAVRDMSDEEIAKCVDPHSIEALDFLRLSYKPPRPLGAVITPLALYKYDQLFKLLIRVLRMNYSVNQLFRDATNRTSYWQGLDDCATRFRIEAHHFVTSVTSYFLDVGVAATWQLFEKKLDETERRMSVDEFAGLGQNEGLDGLRQYHEKVLDRIMFSLLLRKRQKPVLDILEEIFVQILAFARYSRDKAAGRNRKVGRDQEVQAMYAIFHKKVLVFVDVCRGMTERKGFGEREAEDASRFRGGLFDTRELVEENTIVQLLGRLEMSGYYR